MLPKSQIRQGQFIQVMDCSRCGVCCKKTEMLLSKADIRLLEREGYKREEFVFLNKDDFAQMRNVRGHCVFYHPREHRCGVYRFRPSGCRIYPVIYSEEKGVIVDGICPQAATVSEKEVCSKAIMLAQLLNRVDGERMKLRKNL